MHEAISQENLAQNFDCLPEKQIESSPEQRQTQADSTLESPIVVQRNLCATQPLSDRLKEYKVANEKLQRQFKHLQSCLQSTD